MGRKGQPRTRGNMFSTLLCLILTAGTLAGCGPTNQNGFPSVRDGKAASALQHCDEIRLLSDMGLQAPFIDNLLRCLNDQTTEGDSLGPVLAVMDGLGQDGLQESLDLLRAIKVPDTNGAAPAWPVLDLVSHSLTRGIDGERTKDEDLHQGRFGLVQDLLAAMDIHTAGRLMLVWAETGKLEEFLRLGAGLSGAMQDHSVEGLLTLFLDQKEFREDSLTLLITLLEDPRLYPLVAEVLTSTPSAVLTDAADRARCAAEREEPRFASWVQPERRCLTSATKTGPLRAGGHAHIGAFWQSLNQTEQDRVLQALVTSLREVLQLSPDERHQMLSSLMQGMSDLHLMQKQGFSYLVAILERLRAMPASDLAYLTAPLSDITRLEGIFEGMQMKVGTSVLRDQFESLLLDGGPVAGCSDLTMPPLRDAAGSGHLIDIWLSPAEACGGLPPLFAAMQTGFIHLCRQAGCSTMPHLEPGHLQRDGYLSGQDKVQPAVLRELVQEVFHLTTRELRRDPWYLVHRQLAFDAISATDFSTLISTLDPDGVATAGDVIALDKQLATADPRLRPNLTAGLLEHHIQAAAAMAWQTSAFFNDQPQTDQKVQRAMRGIYPGSAIDRSLADRFAPGRIRRLADEDELIRGPREQFILSQVADRLRRSDIVLKNPAVDLQGQKISYTISNKGFLSFRAGATKPRAPSSKYLWQRFRYIFDDGDQKADKRWGLWSRILGAGPILGLNATPGRQQELQDWMGDRLLPLAESTPDETRFKGESGEDPYDRFFLQTPYSTGRKRALAFYFAQNFIGAVTPALRQFTVTAAPGLEKVFIGQSFFLPSRDSWSGYRAVIPEDAFNGDVGDPGHTLSPGPVFKNGPTLLPRDTDVGHLQDLDPALRQLLALNLVTYQKTGDATWIQPLIGRDPAACRLAVTDETGGTVFKESPCPLSFVEEADDQDYRSMVSDVMLGHFCLLFDQNEFDQDFITTIAAELDIQPDLCAALDSRASVTRVNWSTGYPRAVLQSTILDLVQAGERQLKPGLTGLAMDLQRAAVGADASGLDRDLRRSLSRAPLFSLREGAFRHKRQLEYQEYFAGPPGLVNAALNYLANLEGNTVVRNFVFPEAGRTITDAAGGFPAIINLVLDLQQEHAAKGHSALDFSIDLLHRLAAEPDKLNAALRFLVYPTDAELGDFWSGLMPLGMKLYEPMDWQDQGMAMVRHLLRRETILPVQALVQGQTPQGLIRLTGIAHRGLNQLGSGQDQVQLLDRTLEFLSGWLLAVRPDGRQLVADDLDPLLTGLAGITMDGRFYAALHRSLAFWDRQNTGLNGEPAPGLLANLPGLTRFMLEDGLTVFPLWQQDVPALQQRPGFLPDLLLGLLRPMRDSPAPPHLKGMLTDTLGRAGPDHLEALLMDPALRASLVSIMTRAGTVPGPAWRGALDSMRRLKPETRIMLTRINEQLQWDEQTSPSHPLFLQRFSTLIHPDNAMLNPQLDLLEIWLRGDHHKGGVP